MAGNADNSVSPYIKAWIMQGNICVCGVIGEGTSRELQSNWDSPFEQDNPGSFFEKTGGLLQNLTGQTTKTTLNSAQVWNGNRPINLPLTLQLYALSNPQIEVEDAITALQEFASPEVNANSPVTVSNEGAAGISVNAGRIPGVVSVSIGRNMIYPKMIIESISDPLDSVRDRSGNRIRCTVQLQLQTDVMINKSEIRTMRG